MGARRPSAVILHHRKSSARPPVKDDAAGTLDMRAFFILAITLGVIGFFWVSEFMPADGDVITEDTPYRTLVEDRPRGSKATREPPKPTLLTLESCAQLVNEALKEYVERHADDRVETTTYHHAEENRPSKRNSPVKAAPIEPEERHLEEEPNQQEQPSKHAEESAAESDEETGDAAADSGEAEETEQVNETDGRDTEGDEQEEAEGESDVEAVSGGEVEEEVEDGEAEEDMEEDEAILRVRRDTGSEEEVEEEEGVRAEVGESELEVDEGASESEGEDEDQGLEEDEDEDEEGSEEEDGGGKIGDEEEEGSEEGEGEIGDEEEQGSEEEEGEGEIGHEEEEGSEEGEGEIGDEEEEGSEEGEIGDEEEEEETEGEEVGEKGEASEEVDRDDTDAMEFEEKESADTQLKSPDESDAEEEEEEENEGLEGRKDEEEGDEEGEEGEEGEEPGAVSDVEENEEDDESEQREADAFSAAKEEEEEQDQEGQEEDLEEEQEVLPSGQRSRKHIADILGYKNVGTEEDKEEERLIQEILKDLKKLSINTIQPMENLYKFKDISTRVLGDAEIFNKPLVLFIGPWSSGKSSIINYLLGTEHTKAGLKTGPQPTDVDFTIIHYTEKLQRISGTEMAAHWAFSGVQKFGQRFLDHFKGIGLPHPLLQKVTIVDTPGILEKRRVGYPLSDVFQWFIDRADAIYFVFDPSKLEIGEETAALIDQIKGRESQTRFLLNKADFVQPHDIMRVTGQLLWNISPLLGSTEAPIIYTVSLTSRPFHKGAPAKFFLEQEHAFLEHLREIMDERVENTISFARRHAVRVRNHAKLVDCYLSTFYKQKGIFGSKKKVAELITKEPHKYNIYEGLSKLSNVSRYDLPDPQLYYKFFKLNPLYEFKQLSETCSYFKGCPLDKLDIAIAYDLPQLFGKYNEKTKIRRDQDGAPSDESPVPTSEGSSRS